MIKQPQDYCYDGILIYWFLLCILIVGIQYTYYFLKKNYWYIVHETFWVVF